MRLKIIFIIITSVIIAFIHGLPHILISRYLNSQQYFPLILGNNVPFYTVDETFAYATRVQESLRGGFFLNDPVVYEYADKPTLYISESLPALVMALISFFSGSVSNGFIISDFILPVINLLFIFWLIFILTKRFFISLSGSLSLILGSYLLKTAHFPFSFLLRLQSDVTNGTLLPFTRSFHPQVSFIFFTMAVISLYLLIIKKDYKYIILSGFFSGLLFYTYIYYLAFFITALGLLTFIYLVKKDLIIIKRLLLSLVIILFIAIPFLVTYFNFFKDALMSTNFQANYVNPIDDNFWLNIKIVLTMIAVWIFLRKKAGIFYFLESFLLSGIVLCNLQYILNKNIHLSGHLEVRAIYPWIVISLFVVLANLNIKKNILRLFLLITMAFLIFYGFLTHFNYSKQYYAAYSIDRSDAEIFNWLDKNTPKGSVVMTTSLKNNLLISSLTHNKVFIPHSFQTFAPSEEILERIFIAYKFIREESKTIENLFIKNSEKEENIKRRRWNFDTCGQWYVYFTRYSNGNYYQCFVDNNLTQKIVDDYQNFKLDEKEINKYKFDYILVNKNKEFKLGMQFRKVYENEDYLIFKR